MVNEVLYDKVKLMVNKHGLKETLRLFDNNVDIVKRAYRDNPSDYLNQFNDLTPKEKGGRIYYVDKDMSPLFYYYRDEENGYVYINYGRIWSFFSNLIGLKHEEIQDIIKNWLEEVYNLSGLTPTTF